MAKGSVSINQDQCIGCGACAGTCPAVFSLGASGKAEAGSAENGSEADIESAVAGCPMTAITFKKA